MKKLPKIPKPQSNKAKSSAVSMPTFRLRQILNDPYIRGIDGKDYQPIKEELEIELYKREEKEHLELMKQREREEKEYFKLMASAHKKKKTA